MIFRLFVAHVCLFVPFCFFVGDAHAKQLDGFDLVAIEKPRVLRKANNYLGENPQTVTASYCERSSGGRHDYYSEGDYWWPDPENPDGPFIRRDGETYPELFLDHRQAMIRLSEIVGTLTSAYIVTKDEQYATHAVKHLEAWFV